MVADRRTQIFIWVAWLAVFPIGLWTAYKISPPTQFYHHFDFLVTTGLSCIVALIPIVVNQIPFSVTQWLTLFVFLKYGLFAEGILAQIITFIVLLRLRLPKEKRYNFPLNSIMFMIVSLVSGVIFYIFGGEHIQAENLTINFVVLAGLYMVSYFMINQILFTGAFSLLYKTRKPLITKAFLWEGLMHLIAFPVGITLFFLYDLVGVSSFLLVGAPIICTQLILLKYNTSKEINQYLQEAVETGHRLTERLKSDEVLNTFIDHLLNMFPADYLYIFDHMNDDRLQVVRCYENGEFITRKFSSIKKGEGIIGQVWATGQFAFYRDKQQWKNINTEGIPEEVESVLVVPIIKNNAVSGVLFLGTQNKVNDYQKYHLMILDILCSYLAVALENARHYEKTKKESERDPLTKQYNARVCRRKLRDAFNRLHIGKLKCISLLMLDIDYFKSINDQYGHQSGNEILIQMSDLLRKIVGNQGTLTRYGGEEFIIILPDIKKDSAIQMGESIRQTIENYPFHIHDNLTDERKTLSKKITVSIGIASAPADTDNAISLIRYADRALYLGAKRVGRNKVAEYVG
ncbi:sensor domain-containing diguanylate cyclase [Caldifermentibacillus hisashii]|uniref:sensor domain-containing diguanylate cyclase n=1 Tax=Caldifermentibacillus hisashii TaxID=996558 RepID=UPI003D225323